MPTLVVIDDGGMPLRGIPPYVLGQASDSTAIVGCHTEGHCTMAVEQYGKPSGALIKDGGMPLRGIPPYLVK